MTAATLHVACTADGAYLPFCFAMLRSLFEHAGGNKVMVHYLCGPEFERTNREALDRLVRGAGHALTLHEIPDGRVAGLPPMRNVRRLIWYRVFLPDLLPGVERILYLDADLLVLDRIDELWEMDLQGRPLAAVPNVIEPATRERLLPALGLGPDARYFNSGVMLMDLRAMREGGWPERVLACARGHRASLIWGDQDALNAALCDHYLALHPRWNCMNSLFYFSYALDVFDAQTISQAKQAPAILHFEGPDDVKPWNVGSNHPHRNTYLRHLRAATWFLPLPLAVRLLRIVWYAAPIALRRCVARLRGRVPAWSPAPLP